MLRKIKAFLANSLPSLACVYTFIKDEYNIVKSFILFMQHPDFNFYYSNLINGLDDKSIETLIHINNKINIISYIKSKNKVFIMLELLFIKRIYNSFNDDEKNILIEQNNQLAKVIKLNNNCYELNEYLLPVNKFARNVFFDMNRIDRMFTKDISSMCIIDVGAYIGDSSIVLSKLTKNKIHCFEAMTQNYELLLKTLKMNNITNAVPIKAALGASIGSLDFSYGGSFGIQSKVADKKRNIEKVKVMTLDEYVVTNNLDVGLIAIDIEGSEQQFLEGAVRTIRSQQPTLLISIYHSPEDFYFIKQMIDDLRLGYKFKIHKPVMYSLIIDTLLIAETN